MTRNVNNVVNAAHDEDVALIVYISGIPGLVVSGVFLKV